MPSFSLPNPIEIFYPGTHRDFRGRVVTVTRPELESAVAWFNANQRELPLVVGHPDTEEDRVGVGTRLKFVNDRVVVTEVRDVDPTFKKIVNSGELSRVSSKLRLAGHPLNVSKGIEFGHAGFFGKSRVALEQLREASFSKNDQEFWFMENLEEQLAEREAQLIAREAAFARKERITPKVQKWIADGKILPRQGAGVIALLAAMPEDLEVSFAAGEQSIVQSGTEFLSGLIDGLAKQVSYGEKTGETGEKSEDKVANFAAPRGYSVEPNALDDHSKVLLYCKEKSLDPVKDYEQAAMAVLA
jgi:hypothetical protein